MSNEGRTSAGNFREGLDWLLDELSKPPIIELGKPEPQQKYLPNHCAARCPAAHNDFLLDKASESRRDAR